MAAEARTAAELPAAPRQSPSRARGHRGGRGAYPARPRRRPPRGRRRRRRDRGDRSPRLLRAAPHAHLSVPRRPPRRPAAHPARDDGCPVEGVEGDRQPVTIVTGRAKVARLATLARPRIDGGFGRVGAVPGTSLRSLASVAMYAGGWRDSR